MFGCAFALSTSLLTTSCSSEDLAPHDLDEEQAEAVQHEPFMGFEGRISYYVDEASGNLDYDAMLEAGHEIYVVMEDDEIAVHGFTSEKKAEAWGDPLGYKVSQRHAFEREVVAYADANGLDDDSVEPEHMAFQEAAYRRHLGNNEPDGVAARGTGLLWRGCEGDQGPLQIINTKPFITRRRWRNSISSYTGLNVFNQWTFYDRSWFRDELGTFIRNGGGWWTLCGTPVNERANSIINL